VIEHHRDIQASGERDAVIPSAEPPKDGHENKSKGRYDNERKTDKQFGWVVLFLPLAVPVLVVDTMVLAFAMCVKRLLALAHLCMPPTVAQIVGKRPDQPARKHIHTDPPTMHESFRSSVRMTTQQVERVE
jgi:hypothetical protein